MSCLKINSLKLFKSLFFIGFIFLHCFFLASSHAALTDSPTTNEQKVDVDPKSKEKLEKVDVSIKRLMRSLPKEHRTLLFGAFSIGFTVSADFEKNYILLNENKEKVANSADLYKISFIISANSPMHLKSGDEYLSIISVANFNCKDGSYLSLVQDFKSDRFGSGNSLLTLKLKDDQNKVFKFFSDSRVSAFLKKNVC